MGRAPCCDKANVKRGPWSPEEDATLKTYIEKHGTGGNWIALPHKIGLKRCGKSCRLRWLNYLRPNIKHGGFTEEEENIICSLYINIGSRWSIIAAQLPGRTDNDIKNYWNTRLKKKLMAKQRKEQVATRGSLLEQEVKRETDCFLSSQNMNQIPYWSENPLAGHMIHPNQDVQLVNNQDQLTKLLTNLELPFYHDSHLKSNEARNYQYQTQSQVYVDSYSQSISCTSGGHDQLKNFEYGNNGMSLNTNQGQDNFLGDVEVYLDGLLSFGGTESYSGVDAGNSSTTSTPAGSTCWGDINSLVSTPVSNFDAYQKGMLQKVAQ